MMNFGRTVIRENAIKLASGEKPKSAKERLETGEREKYTLLRRSLRHIESDSHYTRGPCRCTCRWGTSQHSHHRGWRWHTPRNLCSSETRTQHAATRKSSLDREEEGRRQLTRPVQPSSVHWSLQGWHALSASGKVPTGHSDTQVSPRAKFLQALQFVGPYKAASENGLTQSVDRCVEQCVTYFASATTLALNIAHFAHVVFVGERSERALCQTVVTQLHIATRHAVLTRLQRPTRSLRRSLWQNTVRILHSRDQCSPRQSTARHRPGIRCSHRGKCRPGTPPDK